MMRTWKRTLSLILTAAMIMGLCVVGAGATGETGTSTDPYLISNADDLAKLATAVNSGTDYSGKYVKLTEDIDLGGIEFTPIGIAHFLNYTSTSAQDVDHAFAGTFDGNGHTISNFKVSATEAETAANANATHTKVYGTNDYDHNLSVENHSKGLFGYVNGGTIENLKISGATITGWNAEAVAIGTMGTGTVDNVDVSNSTVSAAYENAGALIGRQDGDITVQNCDVSNCTITLPTNNDYENGAGGLIGRTQGGTQVIKNNTVTGGSVTAYRKVAGLIGYVLQPASCSFQENAVSNVALKINSAAKNKIGTPYYGILFGEVQGNPNTSRAYETYTGSVYGATWSDTTDTNEANELVYSPVEIGKAPNGNETTVSATQQAAAQVDNDWTYSSIDAAVSAANGKTVTLIRDVTENVTIPAGITVTIDLNGHTLTDASGDTITNNGTLTITDTSSNKNGVVKNATAGKTAILNNVGAAATVANGKIYKSLNAAANDYYVVTNHGTFYITGGTIQSDSTHSSAIENGWYYPNLNTTAADSVMTISGGEVIASGGLYTVKNDDYGQMTISGGTFTNNVAQNGTVLNWNVLNITGGTFNAANGSVATMAESSSSNSKTPAHSYEQGKTTISGGYFKGFLGSNDTYKAAISVSVSGGYFTADPTAYVADGYVSTTTDVSGYNYTVAEKTNAAVDVAAAPAKVVTPANPTTAETAAVNALTSGTTGASGLESAAGTVAQQTTTTAEEGKTALTGANVSVNDSDTVTIYVQPYLNIEVKDATAATGTEAATLTVSITPMVKTVASTATNASGINNTNSAQIGTAKELTVNSDVTIKLPIPASMATLKTAGGTEYNPLTIKHIKEDGKTTYYYDATVTREGQGTSGSPYVYYATFTVTNGFSDFILSEANTRQLTVTYDNSVAQATYKVTNVGDKLPTTTKSGYTFNGWKFTDADGKAISGVTGSYTTLTDDLWTALVGSSNNGSTTNVKATADFTAIPTPTASYTLTFNTNKGSAIDAVTKTSGAVIDLSTYKPTKTGYTFGGWFSDEALTKAVTSITLTANTTVYAKWTYVNPFTDVTDPTSFYYQPVLWAAENAITTGTTPTTFEPNGTCTRAQAVTFLWRAAGKPEPQTKTCAFTDVPADQYYYDAVLWAVENKITKGVSDTQFDPDATVSRGQIVTFLYRLNKTPAVTGTSTFTDVTDPESYYYDAVLWATSNKITTGKGDNRFAPDDTCTRGEIVTFLNRAFVK